MSLRASALLIAAFCAAMQWLVLPPDGFVTGDQGSKFLQARAFADQGPLNPSIEVMSRDIDPDYQRQEPKLKNRRGRLVSEFLWLLPLLSAPFLRVLGMRGLYVIPAMAVLLVFWAAMTLGRSAHDPRGMASAWLVTLGTPLLLFGLELWEHAPAAACVMVAAVLLAPPRTSRASFIGAGVAIAFGVLFREEVAPALPALLLARAACLKRGAFADLFRAGTWTSVGAVAIFLASVPMNLAIYGAPLPMHVTQDAWEVARNTPYLQVRRDVIADLLLPVSHQAVFVIALVAGGACSLTAWRRRRLGTSNADAAGRRLLMALHVATGVVITIAVVLPLWRLASGVTPQTAYRFSSAAHTWTFALALWYWPWAAAADGRVPARYLAGSAAMLFFGAAMIVPTSGGSQWSPRFMFACATLLAVPAAHVLRGTAGSVRMAAGGVILGSVIMHATGVAFLTSAKSHYSGMTHWLASRTAPGDVLISNVFWFPEVTATLATSRRFLFSWSESDVPAMAAMAVRRGTPRFSLVTSVPITGYDAPLTIDVPGSTCRFTRGQQVALDRHGLTLSRYGCAE